MLARRALSIFVFGLLLIACGQPAAQSSSNNGSPVVPVFAVSEVVVGQNRVALGLIRDNSPVNDPGAKIHLRFYDRSDTSATVKSESNAKYYGEGLPAAVYVAYPTFDRPGEWEVVIDTQLSGEAKPTSKKLRFQVLEKSESPNVGQPAVPVKTHTVADTPSDQLSSGGKPNVALYQISLDDALKSGKPTVVLFATPGYCQTAMCGPNVKVLGELQKQFGDKINFIHVEVYKYPFDASFKAVADAANAAYKAQREMTAEEKAAGFSNGMVAWKLVTEPWLFLIDSKGMIQARYEGGITVEELTPAIQKLQ